MNVYHSTIEQLDNQTEIYIDAFDATVPAGTSDDQYDILAQNANFDEDDIFKKFEDDLAFCSLRKKILSLEEAWLNVQGDGAWDANADPDNHFIDEDSERALLSVNAEVLIGSKTRYIYYKFLSDTGNWVEVKNQDIAAIVAVSNGNIPTANPNVTIVNPRPESANANCKTKLKGISYAYSGSNRIKTISKVRPANGTNCINNPCTSIFESKIKAKTKGYKKKNGRWRNKRTTIFAGINGLTPTNPGLFFIDCNQPVDLIKYKEKRRKKVKVKYLSTNQIAAIGTPSTFNANIQDNKLYSQHKQGALQVNRDYYDMSNN
jgi:hypothetical protein